MFALLLLACSPTKVAFSDSGASDPDGDSAAPADTEAPGDSGDTAAQDTSGDSDANEDCDALPAGPLPFESLAGYGRGEDFDFDANGDHVAMSNGNLVGRSQGGESVVIAAGFTDQTNGTRVLPDGDFLLAERGTNSLHRIDATTGGSEALLGSLAYPNGVEVSADGRYAFVSENGPGRLVQVDLEDPQHLIVAEGIDGANGVILSPDEQVIYVGTCTGEGIVAFDRVGETEWSGPRVLLDDRGGCYDGINVDVCGNVYYTETFSGELWRMGPDGSDAERLARFSDGGWSWIPNIRWGNGFGGWRTDALYAADTENSALFVVEAGIAGKRHVLAE